MIKSATYLLTCEQNSRNIYYCAGINQVKLPTKLQIEKPIVKFRNNGVVATRNGRGYSLKELNEAGLQDLHIAMLRGIPIDKLRRTTYPENVDKLKVAANKINEPKLVVKEKLATDRDAAKPKVVKKRTIRRKLVRND